MNVLLTIAAVIVMVSCGSNLYFECRDLIEEMFDPQAPFAIDFSYFEATTSLCVALAGIALALNVFTGG